MVACLEKAKKEISGKFHSNNFSQLSCAKKCLFNSPYFFKLLEKRVNNNFITTLLFLIKVLKKIKEDKECTAKNDIIKFFNLILDKKMDEDKTEFCLLNLFKNAEYFVGFDEITFDLNEDDLIVVIVLASKDVRKIKITESTMIF